MYCPGCHKKLDTSLTSCNRCGWQIVLGQCIPRAEHDRIVADRDAEIERMRHDRDNWRGRAEFAEAQFEALAEMAPPPQKGLLLRRLKELAAKRGGERKP